MKKELFQERKMKVYFILSPKYGVQFSTFGPRRKYLEEVYSQSKKYITKATLIYTP